MAFATIAAGAIWVIVLSWMEGRWGTTPGKWVVGIAVIGTDLRPCGFWRGVLRNLLRVVDGIFEYTLGILVVALNGNWQRLGDLAAKTVVVRDPKRRWIGRQDPNAM